MVMTFKYKDTLNFYKPPARTGKRTTGVGIQFNVPTNDSKIIQHNLKHAPKVVTYTAARALAYIVVDLLSLSLPRVPYDTGELRRSGTAVLAFGGSGRYNAIHVGKGTMEGTVKAMISKVTKRRIKGAPGLYAHVNYSRFNETMEDIAVWTHEHLRPEEERGMRGGRGEYYAKKPYTGPKYLEMPWIENQSRYISILKQAIKQDSFKNMGKLMKTIKAKTGNYDVDQTKLIWSKIDSLGYYNKKPKSSKSSMFVDEMTLSQMHMKNR